MKRGLALLVCLTGCSVSLEIPDDANISCQDDSDCPTGTVCDIRQQCRDLETAARGLPGFDISPSTVTVGESGTSTTLNVRLTSQPSASVTIILAPDDGSEVFISKNILTFSPDNYGVAQQVTITGDRDCLLDGPIVSHVVISPAQSEDHDYSGLDAPDVEVTTNDDVPPAGITVTPTTGLTTSETGSVTQFTVVANCKPTADVHFTLASTDDTEGSITLNDVVFTPDNWAVPRVVNVAGKGDCAVDGDVAYAVNISAVDSEDPLYAGIDPPDVQLVNQDVAFSRVTISPNTGLHTSEAGLGQTSFSVVLTCAPSANVTIPLTTGDATEGTIGAVTSLTFTTGDWDQPQSVIVTGVNDNYDDGNIAYTITTGVMTSTDGGYSGLDPIDVSLTNDDDDTASVTVSPTSGLTMSESAGTSFTITLGATPMSPVTIALTSSDPTQGTVVNHVDISGTSASVTISQVDDFYDEDDTLFTILLGGTTSSADPAFNGLTVPNVSVTNADNDTAGFTRWENAVYTTEAGTVSQVRYSLTSKPRANVDCTAAAEFDLNEVRVGASGSVSMTFTDVNYGTIQSAPVTGLDDGVVDGLGQAAVGLHCTSTDPKYNGQAPGASEYTLCYNLEPAASRRMYVTQTSGGYTGNLGSLATIDAICQTNNPVGSGTWKAVIATTNGTPRRACLTANCTSAGENSDWSLKPTTTYYFTTLAGIVGTTNAAGVFTLQIDGAPNGGSAPYSGYWTGLNGDFTTNANCTNWSTTTGVGSVGISQQATNIHDTWGWTPSVSFDCTQARQIVCAEQ